MASVSDLRSSRFLKKTDIEGDVPVTIRLVSQENVAGDFEPERMKWCLFFDELEKPLPLNVTNGEIIEQITGYGDQIEKHWLGKKIVLYVDPNIRMKGKVTGGIRVKAAPNGEAKAPF
jgi:hypothetical protein